MLEISDSIGDPATRQKKLCSGEGDERYRETWVPSSALSAVTALPMLLLTLPAAISNSAAAAAQLVATPPSGALGTCSILQAQHLAKGHKRGERRERADSEGKSCNLTSTRCSATGTRRVHTRMCGREAFGWKHMDIHVQVCMRTYKQRARKWGAQDDAAVRIS